MPTNIESRIVSMVFDNKLFEKNVATSQQTIKELNKSLEFKDADKNFRSLENASKMVTFAEMKTSIEDIGVKLKASTIIGIELLKDLTNTAINFAKTWVSKVVDPIASGGWNRAANIENAKFQLAGLGIAWEEVSNDIDYGVKDTAYGLDSAAKAASQLAASGIEFGEVFGTTGNSPMAKALRGISGVAAMTNSSYDEIAEIFTKIAGNGRMYGDELQRLSSRGMNAAANLADYFNKVLGGEVDNVSENVRKSIVKITGGTKVAESEIREFVSDGLISFDIFSEAMNTTFGDHAKEANKTFDGALSNMKAALSRIGAEFATSYRSNMIEVYNALRVSINDIKKVMGPIFETVDAVMTDMQERFVGFVTNFDTLLIKGGAFKTIFEGVADLIEGAYEIIVTVVDTVMSAFEIITPKMSKMDELVMDIDQFTNDFKARTFVEAVKPFAEMAKNFKEMVQSEEFIDKLVFAVQRILTIADYVRGIVSGIAGLVKDIFGGLILGLKDGLDPSTGKFQDIYTILETITEVFKRLSRVFDSEVFAVFSEKVYRIVYKVGTAVGVFFDNIKTVAKKITAAWEKVFPYKLFQDEEAKLSNIFYRISMRIQQLLHSLRLTGGQSEAVGKGFEGLFNVLKIGKKIFDTIGQVIGVVIVNILSLWKAAKDAFFEIFDGSGVSDFATRLNQVIYTIQRFIQNLMFSDTAIENFKRAFAGIFAVLSIVKDIFVATFSIIARVFNNIMGDVTRNTDNAIDGISGFIGRIGDWLVAVRDWLHEHEVFEKAADTITTAIGKTINFFRSLVDWIKSASYSFNLWIKEVTGSTIGEHFENLKETLSGVWQKIKEFFAGLANDPDMDNAQKKILPFSDIFDKIREVLAKFFSFLQKAWPTISSVFKSIANIVKTVFGSLFEALGNLGENMDGNSIGNIALGIGSVFGGLTSFSGQISRVTGPLTTIKDRLLELQTMLDVQRLKMIATSIALIAASVVAFTLVDTGKLVVSMGMLRLMMVFLKDFMIEIYATADAMGKKGVKAFRKLTTGLLILAPALLIIAAAVKKLGSMDTMELAQGVGALYLILKELSLFAQEVDKSSSGIVKAAAGILILSAALTIMIIPMKAFARMEWEEMAKGLAAVGGLLVEFAIATKLLQGGSALSAASTVVILSAAMLLMSVPMMLFAKLEWEEIGKGLVAVGGLLLEFVLATKLMQSSGALVAATTVTMLSIAMLLLIAPMEAFAHMDWEQIAKGLVAVGALLLEFAIACKLLQGSGAVLAAASVILIAVALTALIAPMEAFGHMEWSEIGKGLLVIAGALAAFVIAGYAAAPVAVVIVALAAALLLLGAAVALAGAGILQMGIGLTMMTGIGPEIGDTIKAVLEAILSVVPTFVSVIMEAIKVLVVGILDLVQTLIVGIFTMFPQIVTSVLGLLGTILNAIVEFLPTLLELMPPIFAAFWQLIDDFLKEFAAHAPAIFEHLGIILDGLFNMLADTTPALMDWVKATLLGIIMLIKDTSGPATEAVFAVLLSILQELAKNAADITELVLDTLLSILEVLTQRLPDITLKVVEFVIQLINSVADTLMEKAPEIRDAIAKLLGSIIKLVLEIFGFDTSNMDENEFTKIGGFLMGGFVGGLVDKFPEFWNKIKEFFKKIGEWFKTKFQDFKDWGKKCLEGLRDGVKEKFETVKEKITGFFSKIGDAVKNLFGIHSPSTMFKEFGRQILFGFRNGADEEHEGVLDKVKGFFGKIGQGVKDLFGIDKEDGMFTGIGKKIMGAFKKAVTDDSGDAESEVTGVFSKVTESATASADSFVDIGKKLMDCLTQGMRAEAQVPLKAVQAVIQAMTEAANAYYGPFYNVGVNLVNGLSNGIKANGPIARRSSQEMAKELETIARQTLGINSPSKVFMEIGKGVPEGMAKGVYKYTDLVDVAGKDMGDVAVASVSAAMAQIGAAVEETTGDPVIRPVLDLTEIENGTNRIANLFDDPTFMATNPFFMGGYIDETVGQIKMDTPMGANTTSNTTNNSASINISVNAAAGQSPEAIAEAVQKRLKLSLDQRGYAFR